MVTTSRDEIKIWKLQPLELFPLQNISVKKDVDRACAQSGEYAYMINAKKTLACLNSECTLLAIYKRDLELVLYQVNLEAERPEDQLHNVQYIDLDDCWMRNYEDKDLPFNNEATISEMRFKNDGKMLRLYVNPGDQTYFFDIDLIDYTPSYTKCKIFEDKSILKYGAKFLNMVDSLERFIDQQLELGSEFAFAEKDVKTVCILDKQDHPYNCYFKVYDVFQKQFTRKIYKKDVESEEFRSEAFDIDCKSSVLIYACGKDLIYQSIKMPDSIKKHMAPKF